MEKIFIEHPWIIVIFLIWTLPWKGAALWRSARQGHRGWFIALLVLNTFAILEILYLFVFGRTEKKEEVDTFSSSQNFRNQTFPNREQFKKPPVKMVL